MKRKVFISGGGGMLACAIKEFYSKKDTDIIAPTHKELDILKTSEVETALINSKPQVVFHTAALHVETCEENPELAHMINTKASEHIARSCQKINAVLVYISSCGLFGDEIKYYKETDSVILKTVYAKTKYAGEVLAIKECKNTFVFRPGWLFGGKISHRKNFVYQRYLDAQKTKVLEAASDKFGCPTYINDLVAKIDEVVNTNNPGVYHLTNDGGCSRAEYVSKIIEMCSMKIVVKPVDSSRFPRRANVPNCELLDNHNIKKIGINPLPSWQDAIERYIEIMRQEIGN